MFTFLKQCGPFGVPLLIITIANFVIAVRCAVKIAREGTERDPAISNGLNAVLFWGALGAVLGLLGQYTGIYNALGAIIRASEISPRVVATGFRESFTTTLWGLNLLVWSSVAWGVLSGWHTRKRTVADRGQPAG
jgi:biopolymer transport protein ExbB/TolQ